MNGVFATRRRAEEFNALVESSTEAPDPRYADVLSLVGQLRALEPPAPRPAFTSALREQLMEAADTALLAVDDQATPPQTAVERLTLPPRRTSRDRWVAAAVGAVAVVGAGTSIAVAAQSALPGDMLYPVKRLIESAETGVHRSDSGKGASLLSNASDRLAEVTSLSRTSDLDEADAIAATLTTFNEQSLEASDLLLDDYAANGDRSSVEALNAFTVNSMETLTQLESVLPPGARDALQQAVQVLADIDSSASAACPVCRGGLDQIPAALLSLTQFAEPTGVVPSEIDEPSTDEGGRQADVKADDAKSGGAPQADTDGSEPLELPDVTPGGADQDTDDDDPTGPIDGLLNGVTGQGGKDKPDGGSGGNDDSGGGGLIEDTVGAVEDILDLVDDPLAP